MPFVLRALAAFAACIAAVPSAHAAWTVLRKDAAATLAIDKATVKRNGADFRFRYLVDYAKPQAGNEPSAAPHRSMVVEAMVRCGTRQIATGRARMYERPGGAGKVVETTPLGPAPLDPVEDGTSDEDLWKHFCQKKK
jgi:hypothetical protein